MRLESVLTPLGRCGLMITSPPSCSGFVLPLDEASGFSEQTLHDAMLPLSLTLASSLLCSADADKAPSRRRRARLFHALPPLPLAEEGGCESVLVRVRPVDGDEGALTAIRLMRAALASKAELAASEGGEGAGAGGVSTPRLPLGATGASLPGRGVGPISRMNELAATAAVCAAAVRELEAVETIACNPPVNRYTCGLLAVPY